MCKTSFTAFQMMVLWFALFPLTKRGYGLYYLQSVIALVSPVSDTPDQCWLFGGEYREVPGEVRVLIRRR